MNNKLSQMPNHYKRVLVAGRELKININYKNKKMAFETVETGVAEYWQPSVQIRFVKRKVIDFSSQLVGGMQLQKDVNILQQLHISNLGTREWKDVPIETEI